MMGGHLEIKQDSGNECLSPHIYRVRVNEDSYLKSSLPKILEMMYISIENE